MSIIIEQHIDTEKSKLLEEFWETLCYKLSVSKKDANLIFDEIMNRYSEPHRTYHNLSHLYSMLMLAEDYYDFIEHHLLLELSIWFHDLIYDPNRKDNEEKSAIRAVELMDQYLNDNQLETVKNMILSTAKHYPIIDHHDNKLFLDIDLAILSSEENIYQKYAQAIRQEFIIFPDDIYQMGRKQVLTTFLEKKHIYFTTFFRENFEEIARENIQQEIQSIEEI